MLPIELPWPILAIDPADVSGWAYHAPGKTLRYGVWHLKRSSGPDDRLELLYEALQGAPPFRVLVYEEAAYGSPNRHISQVHAEKIGVVKLAASHRGAVVRGYRPTTIKKLIAGHGHASKARVIQAVRMHFDLDVSDDNIADALALLALANCEYLDGALDLSGRPCGPSRHGARASGRTASTARSPTRPPTPRCS